MRGKPSLSSETHLLIGPLEDAVDPHGVLLSGITSHQLTEDGSPITMKLLVPWSAILALGIVEDENAKVKHGYTTHEKSHTLGKGTGS
jgi:hypothetical protein